MSEPSIPFPKLQAYLRNSFQVHEGAQTAAQVFRAAVKWLFELLRNLMIAGVLLFLAEKTGNAILKNIAIAATSLLLAYLCSYLDTWLIRPFHAMKNRQAAQWLDGAVHLAIVGALSLGSIFMLIEFVSEIAASYLKN